MGKKSVIISAGISIALFATALAVSLVNNKNTNEKIDANYDVDAGSITKVQDSVTALGKTLEDTKTQLESKITSEIKSAVATLNEKDAALDAAIAEKVAEAEAKAAKDNESTIANLASAKTALEAAIAGNKDDIAAAAEEIKGLAATDAEVAAAVTSLTSKLEGVDVNVMTEIDAKYQEINKALTEGLKAVNAKAAELEKAIKDAGDKAAEDLKNAKKELEDAIALLNQASEQAKNDISGALQRINSLETTSSTYGQNISDLQDKLSGIDGSVLEALETKLAELKKEILEGDVASNKADIDALTEVVEGINASIADNATQTWVKAQFATLQQLLDFNGDAAVAAKIAALGDYNTHYNEQIDALNSYFADLGTPDAEQKAVLEDLANEAEADKFSIFMANLNKDDYAASIDAEVKELEEVLDEEVEKWHLKAVKATAISVVGQYADEKKDEIRNLGSFDYSDYTGAIEDVYNDFDTNSGAAILDMKTVAEVEEYIDKAKFNIDIEVAQAIVFDSAEDAKGTINALTNVDATYKDNRNTEIDAQLTTANDWTFDYASERTAIDDAKKATLDNIAIIVQLAKNQDAENKAYADFKEEFVDENASEDKGKWRKKKIYIATVGEPYLTNQEIDAAVAAYEAVKDSDAYDYSEFKDGQTVDGLKEAYEAEKAAIEAAIKSYQDRYELVYLQDRENMKFFQTKQELLRAIDNAEYLFDGEIKTPFEDEQVYYDEMQAVQVDEVVNMTNLELIKTTIANAYKKIYAIKEKVICQYNEINLIAEARAHFADDKTFIFYQLNDDGTYKLDEYDEKIIDTTMGVDGYAMYKYYWSTTERASLITADDSKNYFAIIDGWDKYDYAGATTTLSSADDYKERYAEEVADIERVIEVFERQFRAIYANQTAKNYIQKASYDIDVSSVRIEGDPVDPDAGIQKVTEIEIDVKNAYVGKLSKKYNANAVSLFNVYTTVENAIPQSQQYVVDAKAIYDEFVSYITAVALRNETVDLLNAYTTSKDATYGYNGLNADEVKAYVKSANKVTSAALVASYLNLVTTDSSKDALSNIAKFNQDVADVLAAARVVKDAHEYGYAQNMTHYASIYTDDYTDAIAESNDVASVYSLFYNYFVNGTYSKNTIANINSTTGRPEADVTHANFIGTLAQENNNVLWDDYNDIVGGLEITIKGYSTLLNEIYTGTMADQCNTREDVDAKNVEFNNQLSTWKSNLRNAYKALDGTTLAAQKAAYVLKLDDFWLARTAAYESIIGNIGNELHDEAYEIYQNYITKINSVSYSYLVDNMEAEAEEALKDKLPIE